MVAPIVRATLLEAAPGTARIIQVAQVTAVQAPQGALVASMDFGMRAKTSAECSSMRPKEQSIACHGSDVCILNNDRNDCITNDEALDVHM
jgi:hypothetical protein